MEQDQKEKVAELEEEWATVKVQLIFQKMKLDLVVEELLGKWVFVEEKAVVGDLENKNA